MESDQLALFDLEPQDEAWDSYEGDNPYVVSVAVDGGIAVVKPTDLETGKVLSWADLKESFGWEPHQFDQPEETFSPTPEQEDAEWAAAHPPYSETIGY